MGYVPVHRTEKNLLNSDAENNWKYLPLIKALTAMAALFHDFGKASKVFQNKLNPNTRISQSDPIRHEWISCLLLRHFMKDAQTDDQWLDVMLDEADFDISDLSDDLNLTGGLPLAASLILWLIMSHHRLPLPRKDEDCRRERDRTNASLDILLNRLKASWGYENRADNDQAKYGCLSFPEGLPCSEIWQNKIKIWARELKQCLPLLANAQDDGSWRLILHHARLCLMLGDHNYSSQDHDQDWDSSQNLYANTYRDTGEYNQFLDEHLINVARAAVDTANLLPFLETEPLSARDIDALNPSTKTPPQFKWQDKAVAKIKDGLKDIGDDVCGAFVVNMASTGCGKTIANAKVMQTLSHDQQCLRYILALGLRTLTLQTGDEYRNQLGMTNQDLAVLIGSKAVQELHQNNQVINIDERPPTSEQNGKESEENLQDDDAWLSWDGDITNWQGVLPEDKLSTVLKSQKDRSLLYAPVLTCTIDHIMAATETKRGGRYLLPTLRLMSSDLVIDEIDDFIGDDLIAIGRLVHLAGMLGRKVMISSATIPPDFALGFFNAYRQGWKIYAACRNASPKISTIWIDEFETRVGAATCDGIGIQSYQEAHKSFVHKRCLKLSQQPATRKAAIYPCSAEIGGDISDGTYFTHVKDAFFKLHDLHHTVDEQSGVSVSFGVVRVANIRPCVALTKFLLTCDAPEGYDIRVMAYHSQQILLLRHEQERHLDQVLKRKEGLGEAPSAFCNQIIRGHINQAKANHRKHLVFILVATPVEEVGRDHDFDWAVIEPSSYRSIIQMAGRVRRHRVGEAAQANIGIMQYNLKGYGGQTKNVFAYPGYETEGAYALDNHDMKALVDEGQLRKSVNAVPRITYDDREKLTPKSKLADLEHVCIANTLGIPHLFKQEQTLKTSNRRRRHGSKPVITAGCDQLQGYLDDYWWLTALPQYFNGFRKGAPSISLNLLPKDDKTFAFQQWMDGSGMVPVETILNITHKPLNASEMQRQRLWLVRDYEQSLADFDGLSSNLYRAAQKYGEINFIHREHNQYVYNDQLGLYRV